MVARFDSERQALALMEHPHIAHVYDAGGALVFRGCQRSHSTAPAAGHAQPLVLNQGLAAVQ